MFCPPGHGDLTLWAHWGSSFAPSSLGMSPTPLKLRKRHSVPVGLCPLHPCSAGNPADVCIACGTIFHFLQGQCMFTAREFHCPVLYSLRCLTASLCFIPSSLSLTQTGSVSTNIKPSLFLSSAKMSYWIQSYMSHTYNLFFKWLSSHTLNVLSRIHILIFLLYG